jgi:hypothetical protein
MQGYLDQQQRESRAATVEEEGTESFIHVVVGLE